MEVKELLEWLSKRKGHLVIRTQGPIGFAQITIASELGNKIMQYEMAVTTREMELSRCDILYRLRDMMKKIELAEDGLIKF